MMLWSGLMNASESVLKADLISLNTSGNFAVRIQILTGLHYRPKIYPGFGSEFIERQSLRKHTKVKAIDGINTSSRTMV
jgi:hypothetical protein